MVGGSVVGVRAGAPEQQGVRLRGFVSGQAGDEARADPLDVWVRETETGESVPHNEAGIEALCERLTALAPDRIVVEATGGREVPLAAALQAARLSVAVVTRARPARSWCGTARSRPWAHRRRPVWRVHPRTCSRASGSTPGVVAGPRRLTGLGRTAGTRPPQRARDRRPGRCGTPEPGQWLVPGPTPGLGQARLRAHDAVHDHRDRYRHNPAIRDFYTRLCQRGKPRKVALGAAIRKLLLILDAVVRD